MPSIAPNLPLEVGLEKLLVDAVVTDKANRPRAIITKWKSGRQAWAAARFVDGTGDGDLAAQAGCRF